MAFSDIRSGGPSFRLWFLVLISFALVILAAAAYVIRLSSTEDDLGLTFSNSIAYPIHSILGRTMNEVGLPPSWAAMQWVKAATHSDSDADIDSAARGLAEVIRRSPANEHVELSVCAASGHGSPALQRAVAQAGIVCSFDLIDQRHVSEGSPIRYDIRPPVAGAHYPVWYPTYGVVLQPVAPGYWVHNLEHGATVLLYNCPNGCPALIAQLRDLVPTLPLGQNAHHGSPRMLATPYADMDHRFAVIAWGHLLELDDLDWGQVEGFYNQFVDRGPECYQLQCPE